MPTVDEYIDQHFEETVAKLKTGVAQPSISTEGRGVAQMAEMAATSLRDSGFEVRLFETLGFPVLFAEAGPAGAPTVLIYNHYDVQPTGDLAEWTSPPFEPEIRDGKLFGRGVADTKGNIVSRLDALNAVRAVRGSLPVRVSGLSRARRRLEARTSSSS